VDDPKKLRDQKPDYVKDVSGVKDPDHQPQIGTDPMDEPDSSVQKTVISPDPEKVREHDRRREQNPDLRK
jgi:hypothetical protein